MLEDCGVMNTENLPSATDLKKIEGKHLPPILTCAESIDH